MPSTHSTTQPNMFRSSWRRLGTSRIGHVAFVMASAVALVPMTPASSSGAGTTAVAAATADPLAVAAANALDLLRGGTGNASVRPPATSPPATSLQTQTPSTPPGSSSASNAGDTYPPASAVAGETSSNTTIIPYYPPITTPNSPDKSVALEGEDAPSQFANAAPISMLPPPADLTVPVTVPTGAPAVSIPTSTKSGSTPAKKAASKKAAITTVAQAVPVEGTAAAGTASLGKTYDSARRAVVELVVARLPKLSADKLEQAWAAADPRRMVAVYAALAQVGTNYRYSGNEPGGFDCSGLTSYGWSVAGVKIPRTSTDQINAAGARSADQLLPGDLVWRPGHIMMYLGAGEYVIDSPQTGKQVMVRQWGRTSRYGSPL